VLPTEPNDTERAEDDNSKVSVPDINKVNESWSIE